MLWACSLHAVRDTGRIVRFVCNCSGWELMFGAGFVVFLDFGA